MVPYKDGDAPDFNRDFCCWRTANCHMCNGPIFRDAQNLFTQARMAHQAGDPWVHLRPVNYYRTEWEKGKPIKPIMAAVPPS